MSLFVNFSFGQKILLRFENPRLCPPIALVCASSVGLSNVFLSFFGGFAIPFCRTLSFVFSLDLFVTRDVSIGISLATFSGFLSSRKPLKEGWRMAPSFVTSRKLISATSFGFTQTTFAFGGLGRK